MEIEYVKLDKIASYIYYKIEMEFLSILNEPI